MKSLRLFIILFILCPTLSGAQPFRVATAPQFLFNQAYNLQVDVPVVAHHYVILSGFLHSGIINTDNSALISEPIDNFTGDDLTGYGVEALYRKYLVPERNTGFYVAVGPHYHFYQAKFEIYDWQEVFEGSQRFFSYRQFETTNTYHRYGGAGYVGHQLKITPVFSIDYYIGAGLRDVVSRGKYLDKRNYRRYNWDYDARGGYGIIGFRLAFDLTTES